MIVIRDNKFSEVIILNFWRYIHQNILMFIFTQSSPNSQQKSKFMTYLQHMEHSILAIPQTSEHHHSDDRDHKIHLFDGRP